MGKVATRRVSNAFIVGLFVTCSIIIIVGAIIWLGANKFFRENEYFVTYFDGSIEGLDKGSPVKYQGVPVGSVTDVGIAPDGKLIQVTIQIESNVKIDKKMRIKLEFAGIAGGRFLQLHYPETADAARQHPKLHFEPPYSVIPSTTTGLAEIEFAAKDILNNMREFDVRGVSDDTKRFLSSTSTLIENQEIYETITSLKEATSALANVLQKADSSTIVRNIDNVTEKLLRTSGELEKFSQAMNRKLDSLNLTATLDSMIVGYDSVIAVVNANVNSLGYQGRTTIMTLNETLEQIKATAKDLRKALRTISDTPSQIFLSKPPEKDK